MVGIYPNYMGVLILGASKYLEEMGWVILAEKKVSEAFAPIVRLRNFTIIMGIVGIIVIVLIAVFLARGITMPIKRLTDGTKKIASGDLEHPIKFDRRNDEIKELGESFNLMMKELKESTIENKRLFLQVKKSRDELAKKANQLERANKRIEDFVYITSHDLKEPLFAIGGYTARLSNDYKEIFDEKGNDFINRIKANVKTMSQKTQEIMEVLRLSRVKYNFKDDDTKAIVKDVVNSLESKIKDGEINVLIQDNLPTISCDRERLKDVFSNLITNAIKFMGKDSQIESSNSSFNKWSNPSNPPLSPFGKGGLREIRVGCNEDGNYYKFFVEDTGIGIQAEYQEQIFELFRKLKDIKAEGTGAGLAIVKRIVELHNGDVWVESPVKEGRGSRFCFTIQKQKTAIHVETEI